MGGCSSKPAYDTPVPAGLTHQQYATMWVIRIEDVLAMAGTPPHHEELQKQGLLVERTDGFFVIFVSHQWVGRTHPDRFGEQLRVLQTSLRGIMDGSLQVQNDVMSQMMMRFKKLSREQRQQLQDAYIWMDWFSIPQGGFGKSLHDEGALTTTLHDAWNCIRSIPYCVDCCDVFVALVPTLLHNDTGLPCNYRSWLSRGWCRTEMWMKLLSDDEKIPIIMVSSTKKAEFISSTRWVHYPIGEGDFTVEEDRAACCALAETALTFKLKKMLKSSRPNLNLYRYYLARYETFCNLPPATRSLDQFLEDFRFENLQAAIKQKKGMGAIACAVASEDISMLKAMAKAGAPLETTFPEIPEVDLWNGFTPLFLAAMNSWHSEEPLKELLQLKANVNAGCMIGTAAIGTCRKASAVQLMVEHGADVNFAALPTRTWPLSVLAGRGAEPAAILKLIELRADVNPPTGCHAWSTLAMLFQGHPHGLDTAQTLLDAKVDLSNKGTYGPVMTAIANFFYAYDNIKQDPPLVVKVVANHPGPALTSAMVYQQTELIEFLLEAKADPMQKNCRGLTSFDLAESSEMKQVLAAEGKSKEGQAYIHDFKSEMIEEKF